MPELPDLSGYTGYIVAGIRYLLPLLMLWVLARCVRSMLRERYEPETWAYLVDLNGERHSVNHWECIVGRSGSCDVVLDAPSVSRVHASLQRDGNGYWTVSDLRSKGGTFVNGGEADLLDPVRDGDVLDFAGEELVFQEVGRDEREWLERRRTAPGRYVGPGVTLLILTLFQAFLTLEFTVTAEEEYLLPVCLAFLAIIVLEWFCYLVMRSVRRTGFEPETIAFLLSTLGMSVAASSTPDDMFRQVLFLCLGVALFFFLGWWLRDLRRVKAVRWLAALAAMGLLAVTVVLGEVCAAARAAGSTSAPSPCSRARARQGAVYLHRRGDARPALREAEPLRLYRLLGDMRLRSGAHGRLRHGAHLLRNLPCDSLPCAPAPSPPSSSPSAARRWRASSS